MFPQILSDSLLQQQTKSTIQSLYQQSLPFVKDGYPRPFTAQRSAVLRCPPPPASDGGRVPADRPL